jgi:hypothetical protein
MFSLPASTPVRKIFAIFFRVPLWPVETIQNFFCVETPYSAKLCFNFFFRPTRHQDQKNPAQMQDDRCITSLKLFFAHKTFHQETRSHTLPAKTFSFPNKENLITNTFHIRF